MDQPIKIENTCRSCGGTEFVPFATRTDGMHVKQCVNCGLGIVEEIPADLAAFYEDQYYLNGGDSGYKDYAFAAEHGLSWVSHIVKLLRKDGRILDIGCADGYLLRHIGPGMDRYGIEVNHRMAQKATDSGIHIIGYDLFSSDILEKYEGAFDIVTAIAVFEHLDDFASGFEIATELLRDDGILFFEVPVMSCTGSNEAWLNSSFEHVYYPTEQSIRYVVETRLNCKLVGAELPVKDYASTYAGFVTKSSANTEKLRALLGRLLDENDENLNEDERIARLHLRLIHMAQSSNLSINDLNRLRSSDFTEPFIARLVQLWAADLSRQHHWRTYSHQLEVNNARLNTDLQASHRTVQKLTENNEVLSADLSVAQRDAKLNTAQAMQAVVFEMERSAVFEARAKQADARVAEADARTAQADARTAEANARTADVELRATELARHVEVVEGECAAVRNDIEKLRSSTLWRMTDPIREFGMNHPGVARRAKQAARLAYWSLKLKLRANLREVMRRRAAFAAQREAATSEVCEPPSPAEALPPSEISFPVAEPTVAVEVEKAPRPSATLLPSSGIDCEKPWDEAPNGWPKNRPLISVVIPCFNYGNLVTEAIQSVLEQTFQDFEIIVVEGGSSSIESRRRFVELVESAPSRVRVLIQEKPTRAGANRNFGISNARGKYVCCLDADDRLAPTYLEKTVFFLEHYQYDVVSAGLQFFGNRSDRWMPREYPTLDMLLEANQVMTCSVFRRSLWFEAQGYRDSDPTSGHIHEDYLFWVRLGALGARFMNIQETLFHYRSHGETLSNNSSVLDNDQQVKYVRQFNQDVLTPEALVRARERSKMHLREIKPLRNLTRSHHIQQDHPRTLLLAVPYLVLGGAERLLSAITAHLSACGWHVIIVSTVANDESQGDTTDWFEKFTAEIYHLPRFISQERWKDFIDYLFASRQIEMLWIVGSVYFYDYVPAIKARHPSLKVVDLLFNTVGHTTNNRRYAGFIDRNLVENAEVRQWLVEAGESPERIQLITSGVDLTTHAPASKSLTLLAEHSVPPGTVIVGFSGRWSEEKDPFAMVEIAKRIPNKVPVVFMMTGAGPLGPALRAQIEQAAFPPGRFILCGSVPEVGPYLKMYDILLLPSRIDGRPNVVMEALASGVTVVASRVGALPEMVEDGVHGYLCVPGDYEEFASRIIELAEDPRKLSTFRREARRFAERHLDIRTMLEEYRASFDALLDA